MVTMQVRNEYVVNPGEPKLVFPQLYLRTLATIDKEHPVLYLKHL